MNDYAVLARQYRARADEYRARYETERRGVWLEHVYACTEIADMYEADALRATR